jgi:hypothetical protein
VLRREGTIKENRHKKFAKKIVPDTQGENLDHDGHKSLTDGEQSTVFLCMRQTYKVLDFAATASRTSEQLA